MTLPLPPDEPISSTENQQVRLARSLLEPAGRRRQGAYLVEGLRLVEGAAEAGAAGSGAPGSGAPESGAPRLVLYTPSFGQRDGRERRLLLALRRLGGPVRQVTERVLAHITDTVTPQGVVAVVPLPPEVPLSRGAGAGKGAGEAPLVLVLDGVADPGNAGTLLRAAAGAGATAVLATRGTVDLFSPKVVRAGAGAHFLLPLRTALDWEAILRVLPEGCRVLLADAGAATPYWEADWRGPTVVVVSSEAHGASAEAVQRVEAEGGGRVGIPMQGIESLNVAVAGSILLFEAVRQRRYAGDKERKGECDAGPGG